MVGNPLPEEKLENGIAQDDVEFKRPTHLVADIEFNGLSLKDFTKADFRDKGENGVNSVTTVQTVEECEYVYTLDRMIIICLNCSFR